MIPLIGRAGALKRKRIRILCQKNHTFQESRCFYVVSDDGSTQTDFSYIKCMDNYVRKNYAEEPAEQVSQMYFQRRKDRAPVTPAEASQSAPAETETSQAAPTEEARVEETPAPLVETASQETQASPTQEETPSATPQETPAAIAATPQETPAATETIDKWAEKPDSDSAWGACRKL